MQFTVTREFEQVIDVKYVLIDAPVRYDDEDMPYDFPFRSGNRWVVTVGIEGGKIKDWPEGFAYDLHMKVTDGGSYCLLDPEDSVIALIEQDYVPNQLIPGEFGDYIIIQIGEDGVISNWPKSPDISQFFDS